MFKKIIPVLVMGAMLTACEGKDSPKVASLQKKDKSLSCSEVQLEINEAEFYRKTAETNKNPNVKSLIMPLGYISTYVNAEDAAGAAQARIEYLNRIYDILNCDDPATAARSARAAHPYGDYEMGYGGGGSYAAPNPARYAPMSGEPYYSQPAYPQAFRPISAYGAPAYGNGYRAAPRPAAGEEWYW